MNCKECSCLPGRCKALMVYYLQLLSGCQSLCLLALNIRYQHSCRMVWEMFEPCWELLLGATFSAQEYQPHASHGNARIWSSLSFDLFSHIKRNTSYSFWESYESLLPSKIKCGNQYVLSLPLTARTIQYLIGLKLCGIDCSDQDTGQATIVLKLSICSTKKETIVQRVCGVEKKISNHQLQ